MERLQKLADTWAAHRALFDIAIEHLSFNKIAIPAYSTLQKIISQVLVQHQASLHQRLAAACSSELVDMLDHLLSGEQAFTLQHLRQCARNFTGTELQKELAVYHHLHPWMSDSAYALQCLNLSQANQNYYAGRVDY